MTVSDSRCIGHEPCPKCGSKDNLARYDDGHGYCFGCAHYEDGDGTPHRIPQHTRSMASGDFLTGEVRGVRARDITDETARQYQYAHGKYKGKPCQIANYYNRDGELVAQKVRLPNKDFRVIGDISEALPFGAHAFNRTGKMLVVTEGEIDALSAGQALGNKWPAVSIPTGAGPQIKRYIASIRDYLMGFETVVLAFDADAPGREAAKIAAEIIGPTAKIAHLPMKDANEMLKAGKVKELVDAFWRAEEFRPDGIVSASSLREKAVAGTTQGRPWPWQEMTRMTYGRRPGEVYTFGAGTGIGKTTALMEMAHYFGIELEEHVGLFFFETPPDQLLLRLAGVHGRKAFHVPADEGGWAQEELEAAVDAIIASDRFHFYDAFGSARWDWVEQRIRYLATAKGVTNVFIDHLAAFALEEEDERRGLDAIMANLAALAKELGICIYLVSHLTRPEKGRKPHEEGGRVMLKDFRGSNAIGMWTHYAFGFERNQQHDDEDVRGITTVRCTKDRYTGRATGQTFHLRYDHDTSRLVPCAPPPSDGEKPGRKYGFTETDNDDF